VTPSLQGALEALYGQERRRDKLGLDGTRALLGALGHPERRFRAVHVAGTNGKGSTCALIERVLRAAGVRTGLFTSPHLVDFRERIRVGGRWPDEARLHASLARIEALPEGRDRTFFEVATALGFLDFAERGVEWAVVEVGLGGRLDATNVLEPEVCAITSIGLDHTEILGATLDRIAFEKAGIAKPGTPLVTAEDEGAAFEAIAAAAAAQGAPLVRAALQCPVWRDAGARTPDEDEANGGGPCALRAATGTWGDLTLETGFGGAHPINVSVALAVLELLSAGGLAIPRQAVLEGFRRARWPGRLERAAREPRLWWDGAHNAHGAARLAAAWRDAGLPPARALAIAVSRDKDVAAMLAPLGAVVPGRHLFATRTRNERALEPERVIEAARAAGWTAAPAPDVAAACAAALSAAGAGGLALLTGSLFAVGEAMERFGGAPGEML
jgi:dihydrofolate synthase/folylpolyglutamate synthase